MTEVLSPPATSASSSLHDAPPSPDPLEAPLRPRDSRPPRRERIPSYAQNRMSAYSQRSSPSRPRSSAFPAFQSSLAYAQVRDFAYPLFHPMHYGAPPDTPSRTTTPGSERNSSRRLSDPLDANQARGSSWSAGPWGGDGVLYGDPESEDGVESLPSTSFGNEGEVSDDGVAQQRSKHRKSKSYADISDYERGRRRESSRRSRRVSGEEPSDLFQLSDPAGRNTLRQSRAYGGTPEQNGGARRDSRFAATTLPTRTFHNSQSAPPAEPDPNDDDAMPLDAEIPSSPARSPQRQSIGPEDEDLYAGPSLALYPFEPENANELRLREMQVIMVSYRHGQGWLVAEDPESGEQGLVPEEYVRLLSDIPNYDVQKGEFVEMDDLTPAGDEEGEANHVDLGGAVQLPKAKGKDPRVDEAYEEPTSDDALEMAAKKRRGGMGADDDDDEDDDDEDDDDEDDDDDERDGREEDEK